MANYENYQRRSGGKALFGFIIILLGVGIFLKQLDLLPHIYLQFTWPIILIVIGLFIGLRNGFRSIAPFILIAIGIFNLIPGFTFNIGDNEVDSEEVVAPAILVLAGLILVFKPGKKKHWNASGNVTTFSENTVVADVVFGGRKEIITSKDFRGGRISATFGGCEINMLQADATEQVIVLEIRATFGGCELVVPANWEVKNEIDTILGSVQDERSIRNPETGTRKTLVLRGSCFCGGVEIKSF
jgi:predicted membrane protein